MFEARFLCPAISVSFLLIANAPGQFSVTISALPIRVVVEENHDARIEFLAVDPVPMSYLNAVVPEFLPVVRVHASEEKSGIIVRNDTASFQRRPIATYPGFVKLMPDGTWTVEHVTFSIECGGLAPGEERLIPGSDDARVMIALDDAGERLRPLHPRFAPRAPSIPYTYSHTDAPAGAVEADVRRAIERCIGVYASLLSLEDFSVTIRFVWVPGLPASTLAQALVAGRTDRSYTSVRNNMQLGMLTGQDHDLQEELLYDALPTPSQLKYRLMSGGTSEPQGIVLPWALAEEWYNANAQDPLVIEMNPDTDWDFDGTAGSPPIGAGQRDFEGTIVHELGHHFGFLSETEAVSQSTFYDLMSTWDIFRFPLSAGPDIDAGEMLSVVRELR